MALMGNPLVGSWLNFGQFEPFNPQLSAWFSSKRKSLNCLIRFIVFFSAFKYAIILLATWLGYPDLKLILIELYLLDENLQKFFDIGILGTQLGVYLGYSYGIGLDEKASTLDSFKFLLVPDNPKDLSRYKQRYQLDRRSTDKFLSVYRFACLCIRLLIVAYSSFFLAVVLRCLYHSFYTVCLTYFLSIGLPLSVPTLIAYLLLTVYSVSRFVLLPLSAEFLIHRLRAINALICKRFTKTEPVSVSKLRKQRAKLLRALHHLNDFCQQFQSINTVLDKSLSMLMAGVYSILFVLPFFVVFIENDLSIRLGFAILASVNYMFCFSFSICNDRLRRQVGSNSCSKFHKLKSN